MYLFMYSFIHFQNLKINSEIIHCYFFIFLYTYILCKHVHHESIFQTVFLTYSESLQYTFNKCLYSDYFRLVWVGTAAE